MNKQNISKKCVIFDMDGTLIDSRINITNSVNFVRQKKGLPPLSTDEVVTAINGEVKDLAMKFYCTKTYEKNDKMLFEKHYRRSCVRNIKVYRGIVEVLEKLKYKNIALAVATNAPTKFAVEMIKAAKIYDFFNYIKGCDGDLPPKPQPHILLYILEKLNYKNSESIFVGDSLNDMKAGRGIDMVTFFALWGFGGEIDTCCYNYKLLNPRNLLEYI